MFSPRKVSHQSKPPAGPRGLAGPRALRALRAVRAPQAHHRSSILPLLLFFPSLPYHCLGNPTSGPFFFWCVCEGYTLAYLLREGTRGHAICATQLATRGLHRRYAEWEYTKHFEPLLVFCPSWSHLLSSPSWSHFPFMTFSAQHIQSERKTNYIRETGSGLRRFFIGYVKEPTRNSTRLNITGFAEWLHVHTRPCKDHTLG